MEQERKMKAGIECINAGKVFMTPEGEHEVVRNLNFATKENEFLVLFGPGQCGKTTIINMIAGFENVTSGTILADGKKVEKPEPSRGVVFQHIALFPWMTTMGNVEYGLKIRGVKKAQRREAAQKYIDLVGLSGFENSFPNQLSGGMRQRVGIARAYCNEPEVMLMDEPFGAIYAITRAGLQDQLKNLQRNLHKTIMFVTHDIQEAFKLGNKVIIMDKGQVQQYDTPYNILFNPANDYVRRLTQSNSMYDKLCLVSVESVMDRAVPRTDAVIGLGANLGEALTYMVKNQTNDCKVMGSDGVAVGGLSLDKIWDVVRPAL